MIPGGIRYVVPSGAAEADLSQLNYGTTSSVREGKIPLLFHSTEGITYLRYREQKMAGSRRGGSATLSMSEGT